MGISDAHHCYDCMLLRKTEKGIYIIYTTKSVLFLKDMWFQEIKDESY